MTEAQRAAIAAIESQQPQKHNTVWMAGEQLKEIARSEPGSAELLAKDLAGKGMTIADAEKKIAELARKNRDGNCGCVSSEEAEDVLRAFYGLRQRGGGAGGSTEGAGSRGLSMTDWEAFRQARRRRLRRSLSTGPHGRRRTNSAGSSACSRGRA